METLITLFDIRQVLVIPHTVRNVTMCMICALQEVVVSENFWMVCLDSNIEYCQE